MIRTTVIHTIEVSSPEDFRHEILTLIASQVIDSNTRLAIIKRPSQIQIHGHYMERQALETLAKLISELLIIETLPPTHTTEHTQ